MSAVDASSNRVVIPNVEFVELIADVMFGVPVLEGGKFDEESKLLAALIAG